MQAIRPFVLLALALALAPLARAEDIARVDTQATGQAVAVDGSGMIAYVADAAGGFVTSVDQVGHATRYAVGPNPRWIADAGDVYVSNAGDGTVSIIPAGFGTPVTVAAGGSGPIVPAGPYAGTALRGRAYLIRQDKRDLAVVDAATQTSHPIDAGGRVTASILLDSARRRLYAAQPDAGVVRVIDVSTDSTTPPATDVAVPGRPGPMAFNGTYVYVLTGDAANPLVRIDTSTLQVSAVSLAGHAGEPRGIAANFGHVFAGFANEFVILDIDTGNVRAYPMNGVVKVITDTISGNAYALDAAGQLIAVNYFNQRVTSTALPAPAYDMAFIYKTEIVFVATGQGLVEVHSAAGDLVVTANAQGLWWVPNGAESGWGINIAHQDDVLFATWFTYDAQGRGTWLVASDLKSTTHNTYSGVLYRTSGPPFNAAPFDPSKVTRTPAGTMTVQVLDAEDAMLTATVDGVSMTKPLGKQVFASPEPYCTWLSTSSPPSVVNYTDLWWASPAGTESGWGLNIEHQGNILFITWFTYDGSGQPTWYVGSDVQGTGNGTYSGTLYTTSGPPLAAQPWDPSRVTRMPAGTVSLTFSDVSNGTFSYTVGGVTQSKAITRQVYGRTPTRCQ